MVVVGHLARNEIGSGRPRRVYNVEAGREALREADKCFCAVTHSGDVLSSSDLLSPKRHVL